ncbi:hypothetical protein F0562_007938 [Nyssa sinensis]|uniref:Cation-transporting P-type ATPase C-terminal domain-containing protein n=1 Tax=Nyssa sinensis TaxID=561372 RepID=A0A5J5A7Y0_9ASTE|nr:hypothetical protein F0562_007938 [Nyssa sinensis]
MLFSSTSISLPLTSQLNMGHIRVQVGGFSAIFVLLLVASVLTPETLFWYAYPIMILLSSCTAWLSNILKSFLQWVQTVLSMVPDLNIFISTTYAEAANPEPQPAVQGIMGPNFEDGGLVGLKDPCRPGAGAAVEACRDAGVNIKMITGDNIFTAKAIAIECGNLKPNEDLNDAVAEGVTFRNYSQEERMMKIDSICVMARSSPLDKLLTVQCLKQKGHVVAVTGDGTKDAPALKESDIGLSMGIQGTEVAKESSDVVILDDNFTSVVTVLKWGRCVYNNIQKFIQFQLTVNVAALAINFVAALSSGDGTNDAPALKESDIGLSMGIQGTEVAKEISDTVILDDNFTSVVTVLMWGRCVYNNIQKFIQFQLTVNVAALAINFVAALSFGEVQLLWVNLIMDTLGA